MRSRSDATSAPRIGARQPRVKNVPPYVSSAGEDAIALFASIGYPLDEWQENVLIDALGEQENGRWAAFEVGLVVPRQNGKNFILEARELAGVLFFGEKEVLHSAHRLDTARNAFRLVENKVRSTPMLLEHVQGYTGQDRWDPRIPGIRTGAGEMSIQFDTGNKISWRARAHDGGRGLTGDLVVLDEAFDLTAEQVASMMPTMAARSVTGNPQIWYTSSAGMAYSDQLANLRERGMAGGEDRLAYFEWSAEDVAESDDVDAWYEANPALGIRISEEYVRETEYAAMDDEQFRRERLGIWAKIGGDSAITPGAWKKVRDDGSKPGDRLVFAVDVPPTRDTASIACASVRPDGLIHVELVERRVGTSWVAGRLKELQERHDPRYTVIEAGSAAGALLGELKRANIRVRQVSARDYFQACGIFYDAVSQAAIRHIGQEELDEAVGAAQFKFVGDSLFKWNRKNQAADISPLVAASLALFGVDRAKKTGGQARRGWKVIAL